MIEVAPGVMVATHAFCATTTTVVVGADGRECLIVDPGVTSVEIDTLATELASRGLTVTGAFSTHPHWDHLLWRPSLGDAPRWATARGAQRAEAVQDENARKAEGSLPGVDASEIGRVSPLAPGATALPWAARSIRVLEHRAHAVGHAALLIEDAGVLVAGDMLSDVEPPLLDLDATDPWGDYAEAIAMFIAVAPEVSLVVPGHGEVGDHDELVRRIMADRLYLDSLRTGASTDPRLVGAADWLRAEHDAAVARFRT
jgi:glyoxylase-like metal-dependent hydrolase (beta-lactamase superfamily II)